MQGMPHLLGMRIICHRSCDTPRPRRFLKAATRLPAAPSPVLPPASVTESSQSAFISFGPPRAPRGWGGCGGQVGSRFLLVFAASGSGLRGSVLQSFSVAIVGFRPLWCLG